MKRILAMLLSLVMLLSLCSFLGASPALAADGADHEHDWAKATCTEPKTCKICGATEGEPKGHKVEEWKTVEKATCTEPGLKEGVCTRCGETVQKVTDPKGHKPGEKWKTIQEPTDSDRTWIRVKYCERCGEECKRQEKNLSNKEYKSWYKDHCSKIDYKKLERSPRKYEGRRIKFSGKVFQVIYESNSSVYPNMYFIATSGSYKNLVYVKIYGDLSTRILEGDSITVWGEFDGIYTYETVRGSSNAIPEMTVKYYTVK